VDIADVHPVGARVGTHRQPTGGGKDFGQGFMAMRLGARGIKAGQLAIGKLQHGHAIVHVTAIGQGRVQGVVPVAQTRTGLGEPSASAPSRYRECCSP
jgi:hypothetical protein